MIRLATTIAIKHLLARKRQSIVSLLGIVLGVAFFLSISAMMQGSENDFIKRLVDNSPHISISDEFRNASVQPAAQLYAGGAVGGPPCACTNDTAATNAHETNSVNTRERIRPSRPTA